MRFSHRPHLFPRPVNPFTGTFPPLSFSAAQPLPCPHSSSEDLRALPHYSQHAACPPSQARSSTSPAFAGPQWTRPPTVAILDVAPLAVRVWHRFALGLSIFSLRRRVPSNRRHRRRSPSSQPSQWEIGSGPSTATSGSWFRKRKGSPLFRGGL